MLATGSAVYDYLREAGDGQPEAYERLWRIEPDGYRHPEGRILVRRVAQRDDLCEATFVWPDGYGEVVFHRGTHGDLLLKLHEILLHGPAFCPTYKSRDHVPVHRFGADDSSRATVQQGELRLKRFFDNQLLLFIPSTAFAALGIVGACSEQEGELFEFLVQSEGERWSRARPLALDFGGRWHKVRVSNFPNEIGFCLVDEGRLVLVPREPAEGEGLTQVEIQLVHNEIVTQLDVVPIDHDLCPGSLEQVIWSDGSGAPWSRPGRTPGSLGTASRVHQAAAPQSAARGWRAPRAPQSPGRGQRVPAKGPERPPHPAFVPLLARYFGELAEPAGLASDLRKQLGLPGEGEEISPLMCAAVRGVDVRGRGDALWSDLEAACGFKSRFHERTHYNLLTQLIEHGIICRPCADTTGRIFPWSEFSDPCAEAPRRLCAFFGTTPQRVLAEWEAGTRPGAAASGRTASPSSPPSSPPPRPPFSRTSGSDSCESPPSASSQDRGRPPAPASGASRPETAPQAPTPRESTPSPGAPEPHTAAPEPHAAAPEPHTAGIPAEAEPWDAGASVFGASWPLRPTERHDPLAAEHLRIRPRYTSDDDDIPDLDVEDDDEDDGNDGSARGPPGAP